MILNYTLPNAEKLIKSYRKIHTIRLDPKYRWHSGMKIHHAIGMRTKNYRCFKTSVCTEVQDIRIYIDNGYYLLWIINEKGSHSTDPQTVSSNDGFISFDSFRKWFPAGFIGRIIHWTDFRY